MQQTDSLNHPIWQKMLADGCELIVVQGVDAQQCALALSFEAGSYNEPTGYLGMAHFLEHLVFRGSKNYAQGDGLMGFIQRNGGHVNAQTQAQQTLFHFQVESSIFIQAVERLVDMLVAPLLEPAMLASEREVLNEEFALYCQAPQVLMDTAIAVCLLDSHPAQHFYAGNRETLRIEDVGFTPALAAFHRLAYLRSKLKIVIVVPQEWAHWQEGVLAAIEPLTCIPRDIQTKTLPELLVFPQSVIKLHLPVDEDYLVLHIPINQSAQGLSELVEKMQHALALCVDQAFLAYAKQQEWCTDISVRATYITQAQGILTIQFKNPADSYNALVSGFTRWLDQWHARLHSAEQQAYEQQAQSNRWLTAEPLRKAQQVLSGNWPLRGISSICLAALETVIKAVEDGAIVQVIAGAAAVEGRYNKGLPMHVEYFERCSADPTVAISVPQFSFSSGVITRQLEPASPQHTYGHALAQYKPLNFPDGLAVCYWGWSVADPYAVAQRLPSGLTALSELLSYNAVHWQIESVQNWVFIRVTGPATYLPNAVNQILTVLDEPFAAAAAAPVGYFALRRLLQRLPIALAGAKSTAVETDITLASQPQAALWLGVTEPTGLFEQRYLKRLQNFSAAIDVQPAATGWQQVRNSGSDDALLVVYMPLPGKSIVEQDRMRMINRVYAQHFQTVLQRYLRDEHALCYAVFVLPYTQGDYEGLVCAVQSSKVSANQLLKEIKQCLANYHAQLSVQINTLQADVLLQIELLEKYAYGMQRSSEMLFRHWREQHLEFGLQAEIQAVQQISTDEIMQYCQMLQEHTRWFVLSNQSVE